MTDEKRLALERELHGMQDHDLLVRVATKVETLGEDFVRCRDHDDGIHKDLYAKHDEVHDQVIALQAVEESARKAGGKSGAKSGRFWGAVMSGIALVAAAVGEGIYNFLKSHGWIS